MSKPTLEMTSYQRFAMYLMAFLQFVLVLDFMILSPLGAILMDQMQLTPAQFGAVVSAYAFSAGLSGLLAAGFADRFDRKKLLMFFYAGFLLGTLFCALAPNYETLLAARIVTGLFGGVIGSVSFAILADLFQPELRGRAMGTVQSSFAAAQVLGIPLGLWLANHLSWHATFYFIVILGIGAGFVMAFKLKPITAHLGVQTDQHPARHLWQTAVEPRHWVGFGATVLLATGGFMLMPFASAFSVHNLGIDLDHLPWVYAVTGVVTLFAGPFFGKLADRKGKFRVFTFASLGLIGMVFWYTHLGLTPLWLVMVINAILFLFINARIIAATALISTVPGLRHRGSFMAINSSIQQVSGGIATAIAGQIVYQQGQEPLQNYPILGFCVIGATLITIGMMYRVNHLPKH